MAIAEEGSEAAKVGYRVTLPSRLGSLGSVVNSPSGISSTGNWRILKATECSFLQVYADALTSSNSVSCHIGGGKAEVGLGNCSPRPDVARIALIYAYTC